MTTPSALALSIGTRNGFLSLVITRWIFAATFSGVSLLAAVSRAIRWATLWLSELGATLATIQRHCELELAEPEREFPHLLRPSLSLGPEFKIRFNGWRHDPKSR